MKLDGRVYESRPFPLSGRFATEKAVGNLAKTVVRSMVAQRQYVFDELHRRGYVLERDKMASLSRLHGISSEWGPVQRWNKLRPLLVSSIGFLWDVAPSTQSPFRHNYACKVGFLQDLVLGCPPGHVFEEAREEAPAARQLELFEMV